MRMAIVFSHRARNILCVNTIGSRIRALRKARKLTQVQLGARVGIDQSTLSLIEGGQSADMLGMTLARLCQELGTTAEHIMLGITPIGSTLDPTEGEVLKLLRSTGPENRDAALRAVRALAIPVANRKTG